MSAPARPFWRLPALLFSVGLIAALISPALREQPYDSFPLSTYPMFSTVRAKPWIHVVVGYDAQGGEHRIGPRLIANAEVMQAAQTIRQEIRRGQARSLCERVAARVAETPELAAVERLEVQSRQFDPTTYFDEPGPVAPLSLRRRASCRVAREAGE